jgi:glycerate-2-kinase
MPDSPLRNEADLCTTPLRRVALDVYRAGLAAVVPEAAIPRVMRTEGNVLTVGDRRYDLTRGRPVVVGGGKAAGMMAKVTETVVGADRIAAGIVVDKDLAARPEKVRVFQGGHPVPSREGVEAAVRLLEMTRGLSPDDLVLCLISGGGSALLTCPVDGVTLDDLQELNRLLLLSGAPIREINTVRKHLSQIAGGRLARHLAPGRVVTLVIADTTETAYDATASGPTCPDPSTFGKAMDVLRTYGLAGRAPARVVAYLEKGEAGEVAETLKPGDAAFESVQRLVIASSRTAAAAAERAAEEAGFRTEVLSADLDGDVADVADRFVREAERRGGTDGVCLLAAGEGTVRVTGTGKGGRCQELAARTVNLLERLGSSVFLAAGTDGSDFLPGIGGAIVDSGTAARARAEGLDIESFLEANNTYVFHEALGNLIHTDPTHTNVRDLMIYVRSRALSGG